MVSKDWHRKGGCAANSFCTFQYLDDKKQSLILLALLFAMQHLYLPNLEGA